MEAGHLLQLLFREYQRSKCQYCRGVDDPIKAGLKEIDTGNGDSVDEGIFEIEAFKVRQQLVKDGTNDFADTDMVTLGDEIANPELRVASDSPAWQLRCRSFWIRSPMGCQKLIV